MLRLFKKISSKNIISTDFLTLKQNEFRLEEENKTIPYYVLEFTNWVNIVPVTPNKEIILIKQFRPGIEDICIEVPGGMDDKKGENIIEAAKRELTEETGYDCENVEQLYKVSGNPAIQNNYVYGFVGLNAKLTKQQELDDDERIEVVKVPIQEIPLMIKNGEIHHPYAMLSLIKTLNKFGIKFE